MANRKLLTIVQMNDTHAYFDLHREMFWKGDHAVYHSAGGYARIATIVKQIRDESQGNCLFCDCGDTLHGTYPALDTQGKAMIPILNDGMPPKLEFDQMKGVALYMGKMMLSGRMDEVFKIITSNYKHLGEL